jgi:hypothetical protein
MASKRQIASYVLSIVLFSSLIPVLGSSRQGILSGPGVSAQRAVDL